MFSLTKVAVAAGIIAATAVAEVALVPSHKDFPPGLFVAEALRGYAHAPNFSALVEKGRPGHVEINAQGYRGGDWNATPKPVVLLAGSSATFGLGLGQGETIAERLQFHLGGGVGIANVGTYGYGPPQGEDNPPRMPRAETRDRSLPA